MKGNREIFMDETSGTFTKLQLILFSDVTRKFPYSSAYHMF